MFFFMVMIMLLVYVNFFFRFWNKLLSKCVNGEDCNYLK